MLTGLVKNCIHYKEFNIFFYSFNGCSIIVVANVILQHFRRSQVTLSPIASRPMEKLSAG